MEKKNIPQSPAEQHTATAKPSAKTRTAPASAPARVGTPRTSMTAEQRRKARLRREAARKRRNRTIAMIAAAAVVLIAVVIIVIPKGAPQDIPSHDLNLPETAADTADEGAIAEPTATPEPTAEPTNTTATFPYGQTPAGLKLGTSPNQTAVANSARAANRPEASRDGWLPVFRGCETDEKIICITVDDCFQADNLRTIIDLALDNGAKLTIFPIGENVERAAVAENLMYAYEHGFELENHTYTHNNLFQCSAERLAYEMYAENYNLCKLLGKNYQCHFIRPKGGDARNDQRIHTYADQLGYYGIAHWSASGSDLKYEKIVASLKPGQLYLFHTTNGDTEKLKQFIPYAISQGYKLVTMNEMYGYPENETGEFISLKTEDIVPLRDYTVVYTTLKKPNYSYLTLTMQNRLKALGYLKKDGDGTYGDGTVKAVQKFQKRAGLKVTGEADEETLTRIFASDAPKNK